MSSQPSIFLATESLEAGNGGIARVARLMSRVLSEEVSAGRVTAQAIALSDSEVPEDARLPARTARGGRARYVLWAQKAALKHTHFIYDFLGMARAHCRFPSLKRPFLTWIHGIEVWEEARADRLAWARRAHTLISNTAYTRDRAQRLHGIFGRAKVCWLATEKDEAPLHVSGVKKTPTVLILSRFDKDGYKGHKELIACWPKVCAKVKGARLTMVGTGPGHADIRRLASRSPVSENIECTGFLSDNKLEKIWAEASVFAMPSRGEGFGLVYIEAMRHGIPVIASVHDAAPEINIHGQTGFNVNLDREDNLGERLIELLSDPKQAVEMGRAGRTRWAENFRYSAFRNRFLPILREFWTA